MIACESEAGKKTTIKMKEAFEALSGKVNEASSTHSLQITLSKINDNELMEVLKKHKLIDTTAGTLSLGVNDLKKIKLSLKDVFQKQIRAFSESSSYEAIAASA